MSKQYSVACERNREPILAVLRDVLAQSKSVLEIGSGSGQHAVYFGAALPHLSWQCSDLPHNHASILAWQREANLANVLPPLTLGIHPGMRTDEWPPVQYDAVFSANTCHIMAWPEVHAMFAGIGRVLRVGGVACVYGPFNYAGQFTSPSNAHFDASLRMQAPHMGIRDFEAVDAQASACGLQLQADHVMPANNRLLVWRRS
jgi:SAM-dependent methyltransferase